MQGSSVVMVVSTLALYLSQTAHQPLGFVQAPFPGRFTGPRMGAPSRIADTHRIISAQSLGRGYKHRELCRWQVSKPLSLAVAEATRIPTSLAASDGKGEDEEPAYIPGSGLRGVDTSKLTGNERRDAEWFERTAGRQARGELQWFEDPIAYGLVFLGVTVFLFGWAIAACYIPGYCPVN